MDDDTPPPLGRIAATLAAFTTCGVAACFSGGLAFLGAAGLLIYLAATSRPESEFGCGTTESEPCWEQEVARADADPICLSPAVEPDTHWRHAITERRARQLAVER